MPPAKKRARESASLEWLVPESQVEVVMEEPGLVGSRYPARVLQVKAGKAQVEFPAFDEGVPRASAPPLGRSARNRARRALVADEESGAKLKEWVGPSLLTPPPPPAKPDFARRIKVGQPLDLWHEDGWWDATLHL